MKKRNQVLGLIVVLLIIANLSLLTSSGGREIGRDFSVKDTTSLQSISIVHRDFENFLEKKAGVWLLNGTYNIDKRFQQILLAVLTRVRVKGQLGGAQARGVLELVEKNGLVVTLKGEEDVTFTVVGNGTLTKTYFVSSENEVFEVEIPGYKDYVGGIFQLTTDQWKDRLLFRSSIQTIQSVLIQYREEEDLKVSFEDRFFAVEGLAAYDTTAVFDWLKTYEFLQANERMSKGAFERYDSLLETTPLARVIVDDLASTEPFTMDIFQRLSNENIHLVRTGDGAMVVFEKRRVDAMLKKKSDFSL